MSTEFSFLTELPVECYGQNVWARISYIPVPTQKDERYFTSFGFEIEVTDTEYLDGPNGVVVQAEGKLWDRLERAAQKAAEAHFNGDLKGAA
jgi:hypothetical protein